MNSLNAVLFPVRGYLPLPITVWWEGPSKLALVLLHCPARGSFTNTNGRRNQQLLQGTAQNVSDLVKTGQSRNFYLTTWRYDLCWSVTRRLEPEAWFFCWESPSFPSGAGGPGRRLREAGQNSLQTCAVWAHQHPTTCPESLGMSVREGRKRSAHLLFWCLFCIYTWARVLASGPSVHEVCHLNPGCLALLPSMEEFRKCTPEKKNPYISSAKKEKGLQEHWKCSTKDLPVLYLCHF